MLKKIILIFLGFVFLFSYHLVNASPIINEFMYDLDGADIDWIEIYNGDSTDIDLTTLKLFISNSTSNHNIVYYSGSQILHQGEYGIIVPTSQISAFISKWGNVSNLFTASFTLPNESATVEINTGETSSPINSVTYDMSLGAKEDGNSLQLISNLWQGALPTLGEKNQIISDSSSPSEENNDSSSSYTSNINDSSSTITTSSSEIETKIIAPVLVFKGDPVLFNASTIDTDGDALYSGKYFWNFGDGDSKEIKANDKIGFYHTFFYEGEYIIALEYYKNSNADISLNPDASNKITIKVILADIIISKIGDEKDFFVEIFNNTNYDADLSKWILLGNGKSFILPNNTIIKAKKKLILSPTITNFSILDRDTLKLLNKDGRVIFDYFLSNQSVDNLNSNSILEKISNEVEKPLNTVDTDTETKKYIQPENEEISGDNLVAEALKSDLPISVEDTENNFKYWVLGLIVFIGIATSATYFIRNYNRKDISKKEESDFEIIDS